jgi:hypothetical protein
MFGLTSESLFGCSSGEVDTMRSMEQPNSVGEFGRLDQTQSGGTGTSLCKICLDRTLALGHDRMRRCHCSSSGLACTVRPNPRVKSSRLSQTRSDCYFTLWIVSRTIRTLIVVGSRCRGVSPVWTKSARMSGWPTQWSCDCLNVTHGVLWFTEEGTRPAL